MITQKKQLLSLIAIALAAVTANAGTVTNKMTTPVTSCDIGVGPYIAVQGGADVFNSYYTRGHVTQDYDSRVGGFAGLKAGYVFNTGMVLRPAVELDTYWVRINGLWDSNQEFPAVKQAVDGYVCMVNGIARFALGSFQPYVGAGLGTATTKIKTPFTQDDSTHFAWQLVTGMDYYFTNSMSMFLEYKFLNAQVDYVQVNTLSHSLNHLIGAGVRFHF